MSHTSSPDSSRAMAGPLGVCPNCSARAVELVYFTDFLLHRKCASCGHDIRDKPPVLDKKVVYLDQWAISEMANVLDPVLRDKKGERVDPFWRELYGEIETLVKLHAIVCPESPLHYRESLVTPYLGVLRYLYKHLACGTRFEEPQQIHVAQLYDKFLQTVVRDDIEAGTWSERRRVLDGDLNEWSERLRISVHFPLRQGELASEKTFSADTDRLLQEDAEKWKRQPGRSFRDWYDYHRRDLTDVVLRCFDNNTFGIYAGTSRSMVERLVRDGMAEPNAVKEVRAFLSSDAATRVPYCEISGLLYAGMSKEITAFGTKVFAPRQRDEFQAYLRGVRDSVPAILHDTVLGVYGESWLAPYVTILEYHRKKEQGRKAT